MKKTPLFLFLFVLAFLTLLALPLLTAGAAPLHEPAYYTPVDVGNFNDYDSGGSWGGSWDSGSSWDSDYDSGSSGSFLSGLILGSGLDGGWLVAIVVVVIVVALLTRKKKRGSRQDGAPASSSAPTYVQDNTNPIVTAITEIDPLFSTDKFIAWAKEVFITLQTAWMERDWAKIRPFEKEELYRQHEKQLEEYIRLGRINVIERINVNQAYLHQYVREAEYEFLTVYMQVRMVDYIKDEKTGKVLKGNPNQDCHMRYLYTFMRRLGVVTDPAKSNNSVVACPHCGAPTQITSAGQCEYCGFIVTTGECDWVLSNIEAVKPGMTVDNSGVKIL